MYAFIRGYALVFVDIRGYSLVFDCISGQLRLYAGFADICTYLGYVCATQLACTDWHLIPFCMFCPGAERFEKIATFEDLTANHIFTQIVIQTGDPWNSRAIELISEIGMRIITAMSIRINNLIIISTYFNNSS